MQSPKIEREHLRKQERLESNWKQLDEARGEADAASRRLLRELPSSAEDQSAAEVAASCNAAIERATAGATHASAITATEPAAGATARPLDVGAVAAPTATTTTAAAGADTPLPLPPSSLHRMAMRIVHEALVLLHKAQVMF